MTGNLRRQLQHRRPWAGPLALVLLLALVAAACGGSDDAAQGGAGETAADGELIPLEMGVATLAFSTWQQAFRYYDEQEQLINEVGREYGYDITVRWLEFPVAPEMFAAMEAGDVVIGPAATFPLVNQLKAGRPYRVLTNTLGMYQFMLMVRRDGGVESLEDLRGKTVGLAVGTAHQSVFENFVRAELGQSLEEAGIGLASQPAPVPRMPPGLDAYQTFVPAILPALEDPESDIEPLYALSAPPATGPAYSGPLGVGEGHEIPSAEESRWAPEGFIALRNPFLVTDPFLTEHPDAVKAFVIAHQRVMQMFLDWELDEVTDLYPEQTWELMPRQAYQDRALATDLIYGHRRGWVWPTTAEVEILIGESEQMVDLGVIDSPLTVEEARQAFEPTADLLREAYEATGSYPDAEVFTDPEAEDLRGEPVWEIDWDSFEPAAGSE